MAEKKQAPIVSPNKLAMSRALGAAFLNHQVEQLEKSVSNGTSSGNWRTRRQAQANHSAQVASNASKQPLHSGNKMATKKQGEVAHMPRPDRALVKERSVMKNSPQDSGARRRSAEEMGEKCADIIVVDASVLVHALYQVKKWCREGREEVVIVPLEALNTLDLLKKGTTPLAQRARAASRVLEAQVGMNPRIRVQQDDAFVLWDKITFKDMPENTKIDSAQSGSLPDVSPEWVRRTICCVRWEVDNAGVSHPYPDPIKPQSQSNITKSKSSPRVVLAVLSSSSDLSPRFVSLKLADPAHETHLAPVPLPAPTVPHTNKFEPRSSGTLVAHWAARADIKILEVDPTAAGRGSEDEDRGKRTHPHTAPHGHGPKGRRPPTANDGSGKTGLVERPPAVMAMMEMVAQPSKVVRVLARGEKLDPDP